MKPDLSTAEDFPLAAAGLDGRTREARRFKAILAGLSEQLGQSQPTAAEQALLSSAAVFQMLIERDSLAILQGQDVGPEQIRRNFNSLRSALTSLGLSKKSRDITKRDFRGGKSMLSQIVATQ
jgi:hypothetical protein